MGKVKKKKLFFVSFVKINLSINLKCFTFYKGLDLVQKLKSDAANVAVHEVANSAFCVQNFCSRLRWHHGDGA